MKNIGQPGLAANKCLAVSQGLQNRVSKSTEKTYTADSLATSGLISDLL